MGAPGPNIYNLFVAQNFLSSISKRGSHEDTPALRFLKKRSHRLSERISREEPSVVGIEKAKNANGSFAEQAVRSKQGSHCEASSPTAVHVETSTSPSPPGANEESSLLLRAAPDYLLRELQSETQHADNEDTSERAHVTRHDSYNAVPFVCSSSVCTLEVVPTVKRTVSKKLKKKMSAEEVPLLGYHNATSDSTLLEEGGEVRSSGKQLTFLKRWCALTNNGRCYLFTHDTSVPLIVFTHFPFTRIRDETHISTSEERARRLSCASADAADIRPIDFRGVQEVSFGRLLIADDTSSNSYDRSPIPTPTRLLSTSSGVCLDRERILAVEEVSGTSSVRHTDGGQRVEGDAEESAAERVISNGASERLSISSFPQRSLSDFVPPSYDPNLLFNFESENSIRKTTLKSNGNVSALFSFCSEEEAKRLLNEKFRSQYPHVQITYSKIKSIKREMLQIARACDLEDLTLAHAYVFYEKVVLKGMVKKTNRKLVAGVSLLLATKINDLGSVRLSSIVEHIETVFRINRRDMLQLEIPLCVALDFKLQANEAELMPHYQRISFMEP